MTFSRERRSLLPKSQLGIYIGLIVAFLGMIGLAVWVSAVHVIAGLLLAGFILLAVGTGYAFSPVWLKKCMIWGINGILIDIFLSSVITYGMKFTLTGFTAGITFGILVSLILKFEHMRLFPEKYQKKRRYG